MANTDFGAVAAAQKKYWATEVWKTYRDQSFWMSNGFISASDDDMGKPIQKITKLTETERGLECVMQLVQDMTSDGIVGDNLLDDQEESLVNETISIRVDQLRNAVKSKGEIAEQATVLRFKSIAKDKLAFWLPDKLDELMFLTLSGRSYSLNVNGTTRVGSQLPSLSFAGDVAAASTNRIKHAGSATSEATLTANDKMTWSVVVQSQAMAVRKKLNPIRDRGKGYMAMVISTEQMRDLKLDPTWMTNVGRAQPRGSENPLFKNAEIVIDGVILYSHNKVFNTLGLASGSKWGAASTVDGAQALMFGAQAGGIAFIGSTFWRESDKTDYQNRKGYGVGRKVGMLKPQYKSPVDALTLEDFGVISVKTAAGATS